MVDTSINISSGKNISYENFPVGSWLLPRALRPHVRTFYNFARVADDIADAENVVPEEKVAKLRQFEQAITGDHSSGSPPPEALQMAKSLEETNISEQYCLNLITAFKQDATKNRYKNWQELIDYCQLSAAPVGRYMIDLHGGFREGLLVNYKASDALCNALQILNHLQDCKDDCRLLNRVYLPLDIIDNRNATLEDLMDNQTSPALRACLDDILDNVDRLIVESASLPKGLKSPRLRMESQIIISIAYRLSKKLRKSDPLISRVKLSKFSYTASFITGALRSLSRC